MNARTPATFLREDALRELERLSAADLVMKMRNVDVLNRTLADDERARLAKVFERTANEFDTAAALLKRERPAVDVPHFIAKGSTVDLTESRRRRST